MLFGFLSEYNSVVEEILDRYPVLEGEPYTLERTSPRYRGIIKMKLNGE